MSSVSIGIIIVPGVFALLLFLVFTYLYQQSREPYFRAWQLGWAAFCLYYTLQAWGYFGHQEAVSFILSKLLLAGVALAIYHSTRLVQEEHGFHWSDLALVAIAAGLAVHNYVAHVDDGVFQLQVGRPHLEMEVGVAGLLLFCAFRFWQVARQRDSLGFRLLAVSLTLWAPLLMSRQFATFSRNYFGTMGNFLGPLPQMLVGISMVVVLFEQERRVVQENALAFSTLGVDPGMVLSRSEVAPGLERLLERLVRLLRVEQAAMCVAERWRTVLPSVSHGFPAQFLAELEGDGSGEYLSEMAYRRGGMMTLRGLPEMSEPLPAGPPARFERCQQTMAKYQVHTFTAVSLQTRDNNFGVVLFPHPDRTLFGTAQVRLLLGLAMQIGMTLENFVVMHDLQRRNREYGLLTQMGQAISSRLDRDEVLRAIHKELGRLFDTETFYIAFLEGEDLHLEYECVEGELRPRRTRKASNGLAEYVIRTGQPLLVRSEMDKTRARLGVGAATERPPKSYCAVPIFMNNRPAGILAAMNFEHEFVYEQRDLDLMQIAAGQVAVAVENARLFAEEQRRARYLEFLNKVSNTAISSQNAEQMLAEIVADIQQTFRYDHIGIGILDYATKEIEIRAEAGATARAVGKRLGLGSGILGRCARSGEMVLAQDTTAGALQGILADAHSILCVPVAYGERLLGVLNVESRRENAFGQQEVLILRTLADLLATALHNSFIFQKLQQQSITDGLTGIKTRRFFLESLQGEWKRASRSGRPFSVVLIDLDKFKEVNDSMGHLEGDLVLARVGRLLEQKCRQSNVVARYGGDEFVVLMPETGVEQAQILSERLRLWLATDPMLSERRITGSFGVASFPLHGSTVEEIVRVADAGMYVSKHAGGNRVSTAEEFLEPESAVAQRQLLTAYIEGFLQREHTGPESVEELVATLRRMCGSLQSREPMLEALFVLARAVETREVHASGHGEATGRYCEMLGTELGLSEQEVRDLVCSARVHDVGKLIIPEKILAKPGPLTEDEYYLVKMHARISAEIVESIPDSERMQQIIRHHHERFDGSGYPDGLKGEEIPIGARVLAVVDAYTSMRTDRPFAPALSAEEAMVELEACSGTQFDGMIVRLFIHQLKGEQAARKSK
jgi:diguanylate cyclase (GGDEF)-like protein